MPRPGPRRPNVVIRMSDTDIDRLDGTARTEGVLRGKGEPNRSEMIRRAAAIGLAVLGRWPGATPDTVTRLDLRP